MSLKSTPNDHASIASSCALRSVLVLAHLKAPEPECQHAEAAIVLLAQWAMVQQKPWAATTSMAVAGHVVECCGNAVLTGRHG